MNDEIVLNLRPADFTFIIKTLETFMFDKCGSEADQVAVGTFINKLQRERKEQTMVITEVAPVEQKISPKDARKSIGYSQNQLAREAVLALNSIQSVETKRRLWYSTATAILGVINPRREEMKLPPLGINDIDWTIR